MSSSASSGWATSSSSSMQSLLLSSFFPSLGWRHPSVYNFHRHNLTIVIYPHFQVVILISWWSLSISRWWSLSLIRITTWKWGSGDGWQLWRLYQVVISPISRWCSWSASPSPSQWLWSITNPICAGVPVLLLSHRCNAVMIFLAMVIDNYNSKKWKKYEFLEGGKPLKILSTV